MKMTLSNVYVYTGDFRYNFSDADKAYDFIVDEVNKEHVNLVNIEVMVLYMEDRQIHSASSEPLDEESQWYTYQEFKEFVEFDCF